MLVEVPQYAFPRQNKSWRWKCFRALIFHLIHIQSGQITRATLKFGRALRLAPPTPSHPEIRYLEGIPVSAAAALHTTGGTCPPHCPSPQAANQPLSDRRVPRTPSHRQAQARASRAASAPRRSPRTAAPARPRRACALTEAPPPVPSTASAQAQFRQGGEGRTGLRRSWAAARARKAQRRVYVASACRRNGCPPPTSPRRARARGRRRRVS